MRRGGFVIAATLAVMSGCGTDGGDAGPREREPSQAVRWETITVDDTGTTLTIEFTGGPETSLDDDPCAAEYDVGLSESSDRITITLWRLKLVEPLRVSDDFSCNAAGHFRTVAVTLDSPWNGRTVVDGRSNEPRHVIDDAIIPTSTGLPDGWVELYRRANGAQLTIGYGPADASEGFPPLEYSVAPTDDGFFNLDYWRTADLTEVEEFVLLRGAPALLITSLEDGACSVVFEEHDQLHRVTTRTCLSPVVAIDFAEHLVAPGDQ